MQTHPLKIVHKQTLKSPAVFIVVTCFLILTATTAHAGGGGGGGGGGGSTADSISNAVGPGPVGTTMYSGYPGGSSTSGSGGSGTGGGFGGGGWGGNGGGGGYSQGSYYSQGYYAPPSPSFSASESTVNEGEPVTLTWSCVNSSSSSGVNFSTGGEPEGSAEVAPIETTTYTTICSNGGQDSVTVEVLHPELSITADPDRVRKDETTSISWSASAVDSCSVSENNPDFADSWSGTSGTETTSGITAQTTYTLTCENKAGTVTESEVVNLIPFFQEF